MSKIFIFILMIFLHIIDDYGLQQKCLAMQLGVKQGTVAMWETGKALPRADKLLKLAEILGCSVDELLKTSEAQEYK